MVSRGVVVNLGIPFSLPEPEGKLGEAVENRPGSGDLPRRACDTCAADIDVLRRMLAGAEESHRPRHRYQGRAAGSLIDEVPCARDVR